MKRKSIVLAILVLAACLVFTLALMGCGPGGNGGANGKDKTITISIASEAMVGEEVLLSKESNVKGFYQENIKYEFVGENPCKAKFVHKLDEEKNWYETYVVAQLPGTVTIKLSYIEDKKVTAVSNEVSITFSLPTISTKDEFIKLVSENGKATLANDIDLGGEVWTPKSFSGVLYGGGHKITNLKLENSGVDNYGLFSEMTGTISNVIIDNATLNTSTDKANMGLLAGVNKGTIDNVTANGSVNAAYADFVGGIVGKNDNGIITNCTNNAEVVGNHYVGGVVGYAQFNADDAISGNVNNAKVVGKDMENGGVGGIAGKINIDVCNKTRFISNNVNNGEIEGVTNVGGVFGFAWGYNQYVKTSSHTGYTAYNYIELRDLKNLGTVNGSGNNVGGLVGQGQYVTKIMTSENKADITGGNYTGGWVGYAPNTHMLVDNVVNGNTIKGDSRVGGFAGEAGIIENAINNGMIISSMPAIDGDNKYAYLGGIAGYAKGLKNCANNADLTVTNKGKYAGGLAGYLFVEDQNNVNDNVNSGAITGEESVGGIAGYIEPTWGNKTYKVANNTNKGNITGNTRIGGIFGSARGYSKYIKTSSHTGYTSYNYLEISNMSNQGTIVGKGDYVGGIAGNTYYVNKIMTCDNVADITGANYVGGWLGCAPNTNILVQNGENTNTITGYGYVGGFAGTAGIVENAINSGNIISNEPMLDGTAKKAYVGGIAGYAKGIKNCVNNADISVTHKGEFVGGLVGHLFVEADNNVNDNVNNGAISGENNVGGIAGYIEPTWGNETYTLAHDTNKGSITGNKNIGGIFGTAWGYEKYIKTSSHTGYTSYNYLEMSDMSNQGTVIATGDNVGGLVGASHYLTKVITSENMADITGNNYVGGWVGNSPNTILLALGKNNDSTITGNGYVGGFAGLAGFIDGAINNGKIVSKSYIIVDNISKSYVGGIAGQCEGTRDCVNNAEITVNYQGMYIGGIVGYAKINDNGHMSGNENNGIINAPTSTNVAGIVGCLRGNRDNFTYKIGENVNNADITGNENVGGIIGYAYGEGKRYFELTHSTNNATVTGNTLVGGIVGDYQNLKTDAVFMDTNTTTSGNKLGK